MKETPYTPSVSLFYGLYESLKIIEEYGLKNQIKRHNIYSEAIKCGIQNMNLTQFSKLSSDNCTKYSNTVTVIKTPNTINSTVIKSEMERCGIIIATGHDHIKENVIRIGNMGYITFSDIIVTLTQLENILYKHGFVKNIGNGICSVLNFIDSYYDIF